MDCPACGSQDRRSLGRSRYQCTAPVRMLVRTPPPTVGSTWGPVAIDAPVAEPCGAVYTDHRELAERHRLSVLLGL